jgi:uncharacterized SAM-binding protein YcdF (DUF218 family)
MVTRRRTITVQVGWLALAGLVLAVLALTVGPALYWWRAEPAPPAIDPAAVRSVCAQYAALDLSGLAPLCKAAGYQQTVPAPAPEDLGRPTG